MKEFDQEKYSRAKKKVDDIKGFYTHLTVYLVINILLILMNLGVFKNGFVNIDFPSWSSFTTPFFWGIGLAAHGLHVFKDSFKFFRGWEERKIQEYMNKDEEEFKNSRWD